MAVVKAKPGAVADSLTGTGINDTGAAFNVHVIDGDFDFWSPLMETTGDGDADPVFENNEMLYGSFNLRGAMVGGDALNLSNLTNTSNNPVLMLFTFSGAAGTAGVDRFLTLRAIVERIRIRWRKNAQIVGVSLLGRRTTDALTSGDI